MKTYQIILSAGGQQEIAVNGDFVRIDSAAGNVQVENDNGDRLTMREGKSANLTTFKGLRLTDLAGSGQTVLAEIGFGKVQSGELSGAVEIDSPDTITDYVDESLIADTNTEVFSAATFARERIIKNDSASAASVRIGSTNISATRGILLEAGQSLVLTSAAQVFARAIGGTATLQLLETVGG